MSSSKRKKQTTKSKIKWTGVKRASIQSQQHSSIPHNANERQEIKTQPQFMTFNVTTLQVWNRDSDT